MLLAACSADARDFQEEAEKYLESATFTDDLEERIGERVEFTNAVCDRPESAEVGTLYGCTADADTADTWAFDVEITDDDALTVTAAQPAGQPADTEPASPGTSEATLQSATTG